MPAQHFFSNRIGVQSVSWHAAMMNAHCRLQVKIKSDAILSLLSQSSEAQRMYAYLQLTKRFLFQCENQVTVINLLLH